MKKIFLFAAILMTGCSDNIDITVGHSLSLVQVCCDADCKFPDMDDAVVFGDDTMTMTTYIVSWTAPVAVVLTLEYINEGGSFIIPLLTNDAATDYSFDGTTLIITIDNASFSDASCSSLVYTYQ